MFDPIFVYKSAAVKIPWDAGLTSTLNTGFGFSKKNFNEIFYYFDKNPKLDQKLNRFSSSARWCVTDYATQSNRLSQVRTFLLSNFRALRTDNDVCCPCRRDTLVLLKLGFIANPIPNLVNTNVFSSIRTAYSQSIWKVWELDKRKTLIHLSWFV